MSEYQFYHFEAVDQPLSDADKKYLRNLSTRGEITSHSFTNEYHWGNFKGDPDTLIRRCFDAFVYFANWGTRTLMFRLPAGLLTKTSARPFQVKYVLDIKVEDDLTVVEFNSNDEDGEYDDFYNGYEDDESWMRRLLPVRELLLAGDPRPLYLGWLAGLKDFDPDEPNRALEPPVPAGLHDLPDELEALVEYLRIDDDTLATAAENSPPLPQSAEESPTAVGEWAVRLPQPEKDHWLTRFLTEPPATVQRELLRRYRTSNQPPTPPTDLPRRTIGELLQARDAVAETRKRQQAEARRRKQEKAAREAAIKREAHLATVRRQYKSLWNEIEAMIVAKPPRYVDAVRTLTDLRDASDNTPNSADFTLRLAALTERHARRPALQQRLKKAALHTRPPSAV